MHKSDCKSIYFIYTPCKAPSDFKQTHQILKFNSTNTSITVPVPLRSDSVYEHNEIFFCSLSHQPTRLNVHMYPDRTVLYIIDSTSMSTTHSSLMQTFFLNYSQTLHCTFFSVFDTDVTLGFRVADIRVSENVGNAMLIVEVKKGQLRRTISLQYSTLEGTARGIILCS